MAERPGGVRLRAPTTPESGRYCADARAGAGVRRRGQPGVHRRGVPDRGRRWPDRRQAHRGVPHRQGHRLGRARSRLFHGVERFFRSSLCRQPDPGVDPGARRRRGEAARRRARRGHRLRPRRLDDPHGAGLSRRRSSSASTTTRTSIAAANARARKAGVADRCRFEVAGAKDFPGRDYDLVTVFDALHDMGDPAGASRHVLSTPWRPDGSWMIVEPYAGDRVEENLNPVGRAYYAALDADLHAVLARAGGRARARRAGGRGAHARGGDGRRLHDASGAPCSRRSTWCSRRRP